MSKLSMQQKALIGIIIVVVFFIGNIVYIGKQNLWFESKVSYHTLLKEGDGLSVGTRVTLSGVKVGHVTELDVDDNNEIAVKFDLKQSMAKKMTQGSIAKVVRSMMIGNKKIDIIPGPKEAPILKEGEFIKGVDSLELADIISGKRLGVAFEKMDGLISGLNLMAQSFSLLSQNMNPKDMVAFYKNMLPTLRNVRRLTSELNHMLKDVRDNKQLLTKLDQMVSSLHLISTQFAKKPDMPQQLNATLKEATMTLKALQRSFLISGHVEDIKEEEEKKK